MKVIAKRMFAGRRTAALLITATLGILCLALVFSSRQTPEESVALQFVCLTNVPGLGAQALFNITNRTETLIIIPRYGHVGPGESVTLPFLVPTGTSPWRVSVQWQCQDYSWFDMKMNGWRRRAEEFFGKPRFVDPWFPATQVSYSPELQR